MAYKAKRESQSSTPQSRQKGINNFADPGASFTTLRDNSRIIDGDFAQSKSLLLSRVSQYEQLADDCVCGRHLYKIDAPKPLIGRDSTYHRDYPPRNPSKYKQKPSRPQSAKLPENPQLMLQSTYQGGFGGRKGDPLSRPKPQDLLGTGGPDLELSSYRQDYPGHRGKNQYVPVNPELARGGLDFKGGSHYSQQFGKGRGRSSESARPPDQFRMSGSWLGDSSYRNQFQNPKNHVSAPKKAKGKDSQTPRAKLKQSDMKTASQLSSPAGHFRTTYRDDYVSKSSRCPAGVKLQGRQGDGIDKAIFKDNSQFKAMDSRYESLAKHFPRS